MSSDFTDKPMNIKKLVVKSLEDIKIPDEIKPSYEVAELIWNLTLENLQTTAYSLQEYIKKYKFITNNFVSHAISNISLIKFQSRNLYCNFCKTFDFRMPKSYVDDPITSIISQDDISEFQKYYNRESGFRIQNFVNKYFPQSIAYGAINIFKFLLLNNAEIKENYCKHVIIGGNIEIFKIFTEKGYNFHDYFSLAVKFHQNKIADFILENYGANFMSIADCLRFYNYEAAIFMYENKCPIDYFANPFKCVLATSVLLDDYYTTDYFIENNANINELFITAVPPNIISLNWFLIALLKNNTDIIKLLYSNGANFSKNIVLAGEEIETALTIAVRNQNEEIITLLLSNGADANCSVLNDNESLWKNEFFCDFFEQSIDFSEISNILNAGIKENINNSSDSEEYCENSDERDSYNEEYDDDYSYDYEEEEESEYEEKEEEKGISVKNLQRNLNKRLNKAKFIKINPLIIAITLENVGIIKMLVDYGAVVNSYIETRSDSITPLIFAIKTCTKVKLNVVDQLLSCGADPNLLCITTPIQESLFDTDKSVAMKLLEYGADANYFNPKKDSPLILAIKRKFEDLVLEMLKKGTNPNFLTVDLETPLELAKSLRLKSSYDALLKFGANPNISGYKC